MNNKEDQNTEEKYSEFEQQCIDVGWNPKGKKSANEWALDGLSIRNEKITDLYKITENLKDLMTKQEQTAFDRAKAQFMAEKNDAISRGDVQQVHNLEQEQQMMAMNNHIAQHAQAFVEKNSDWYRGVSPVELKMQKACREMDIQLQASQGLPPEKHFEALENYIKDEFPEYFDLDDEPVKKKASKVEGKQSGVVRTSNSNKRFSINDLSADQKYFANLYVKRGLGSEEKYIEELIKAGTLK